MRVAIIGCGYAGGAAALFLARAGHEVTVFEAVPRPAPVGAGILVQPTGMAVLAKLGLLEDVLVRAARIDALTMRTVAGRKLMRLSYGALGDGWFGAGLHRGALYQCLHDAVQRELGERLRCGITITEASGGLVRDESGERHGPFELVVVADGARSRIRDRLGGARVHTYRWATAWLIAPDQDRACAGELHQVVDGTRHLVGLLPTGLGPRANGADDRPLVSLYWGIDSRRVDEWRRAGLDAFRTELARFDRRAAALTEPLDDIEQVLVARYHRVIMRPWHRDGIVVIGDAAHAMSPQLGQGTNLALWDAMVLAECLSACRELPRALGEYSRRRRAPIAYYELAAHWLMPMFQHDWRPMGMLRDVAFALLSRLPFARRQMLQTMAGIKRGIFRPALRLELPKLPPPGA